MLHQKAPRIITIAEGNSHERDNQVPRVPQAGIRSGLQRKIHNRDQVQALQQDSDHKKTHRDC